MAASIKWLGHASFKITDSNQIVYIDPYNMSAIPHDADFVFCTHTHYDHLSAADIKKVMKDTTQIIVTSDGAAQAESLGNKIITALPDEEYTLENIKFFTVPAYNINKSFHPKANQWVGYIIQFSDGTKFFHAGDSDNIPEYQKLSSMNIDVLAVPCGGTYTMNAAEAAEAAKIIMPKQVIPMHWGSIVGTKQDALNVKKYLEGTNIEVLIMGQ